MTSRFPRPSLWGWMRGVFGSFEPQRHQKGVKSSFEFQVLDLRVTLLFSKLSWHQSRIV